MAEDVDSSEQKRRARVERAQTFLDRAKTRVDAELKPKQSEVSHPERKILFESGEPAHIDMRIVDQVDDLLLEKAKEKQAWLRQHPSSANVEKTQEQVEVLSTAVGREHTTPGDIRARMFGVGFLMNENLRDLPKEVGGCLKKIEHSRSGPDYSEGVSELDRTMQSISGDERGRVEAILKKRKTLNRLMDYLDRSVSGDVSVQERFMDFLLKFGKDASEGSLRRIVAGAIEKRLGFGYMGVRPREVYSTARLEMEKRGADPIQLMAVEVEERRKGIEQDVENRLGETKEAPAEAEVPPPEAELEVSPKEKPRPRTLKEELEERLATLDREIVASGVAGDEWDRYERLGKERAEVAAQLRSLGGKPEEAEAQAKRVEEALPPDERKALEEMEQLAGELQKLVEQIRNGEVKSPKEAMAVADEIFGIRGRAAEKPEAGKETTEEPDVEKEEKELDDKVEQAVAKGSEWTKGKDPKAARLLLEELAEGRKSIKDLANELYPGKENRAKRSEFRDQFKKGLLSAGIVKEEEVQGANISELERIFRRTIDRVVEAEPRLKANAELKKQYKKLFVFYALEGSWDNLKAAIKQGLSYET